MTEISKVKIREANIGKEIPAKVRVKMRAAKIGRTVSQETISKISPSITSVATKINSR